MIKTRRRVVVVDGKEFIIVKLAQAMGNKDKLLCIGPDGENHFVEVKHMEFISAKFKEFTIKEL